MASSTALVTAAVAGAAAGWGLRPAIARFAVPADQPWASACRGCGTPLSWRSGPALSPRGRCGCGARPGAPALVPEVLAALAFTALVAVLGIGPALWPALWLAACGTALAVVDALVHRLPDPLTATTAVGTAVLLAVLSLTSQTAAPLLRAAVGAVVLGALYLAMAIATPLGLGDAKLAPTIGAILAWYGWKVFVHGSAAAIFLVGLYAAVLLLVLRRGRRDDLSFGPFMFGGALLAIALDM
ncbi:prepilin peptidase [Kitasatospora sp. MBT66]|uniref:prepilin peptidase n=1 Tax=Kitasatospora sp. MBT66 TaxID=1444769 RepID=UPI0005BCDF89|nr:prepilin peptidase [Kitasatospora sp. MBT66]